MRDSEDQKAAEVISQMKADTGSRQCKYWLMKAEPDTRIEKGVDVAFPIEKLEELKTTSWDGVRNSLAKRYMKEVMKIGDKVLFYHSNTKMPGVAGLAVVCKESYPDYTAFDPNHPYYDASSKREKPTWYMVDVEFAARLKHFVPLSLFKYLAGCKEIPKELPYLTPEHLEAIKSMPLITRGRLSVQEASQLSYEATVLMGENGGFEGLVEVKTSSKAPKKRAATAAATAADDTVGKAEETPNGNVASPAASTSRQPARSTRSSTSNTASTSAADSSLSKRPRRG